MGQKVNPIGLRLGINRTWDSRWFAGKGEYGKLLHEDMAIREALMKQLKQAAVSKIVIERPHKKCRVTIHSARPGVVIGKKGADIEKLRKLVDKMTNSDVDDQHRRGAQARGRRDAGRRVDRPAARAPRGVPPRHEARRAVGDAPRRRGHPHQLLGPSRRRRDRAPWNGTARAACRCTRCAPTSITASPTAYTTYGTCGIKVWIFKGEILEHDPMAQDKRMTDEGGRSRRPPRARGVSRTQARGEVRHAATEEDQVPQAVQGPHLTALRRAARS